MEKKVGLAFWRVENVNSFFREHHISYQLYFPLPPYFHFSTFNKFWPSSYYLHSIMASDSEKILHQCNVVWLLFSRCTFSFVPFHIIIIECEEEGVLLHKFQHRYTLIWQVSIIFKQEQEQSHKARVLKKKIGQLYYNNKDRIIMSLKDEYFNSSFEWGNPINHYFDRGLCSAPYSCNFIILILILLKQPTFFKSLSQ